MILFKKLILYILIKNKLSKYLYKNSKDANQIINKNIFNFLKLVKREYIDFNCSFFFKNFILSTFFKRFFLFNNYFMNLIFFKKFSFPKKKNFNFFKIFKKRFKKLNLIASETKKPKNQEKKIEKKYEKKKIKKKKLKKSKSLFKIRARTKINNFNIDNNYYLIKYNNLFNFFLSKKKFKLNDSKKKVRYLIFCFKNIFFLKNAYKPNKYEMHKPVSFVKVTATKLNKKKFFFFKQKEIFFFKNNLKLIQKIKNKFLIGILIPDNMQIFLEQIKFNFYLFFKNNFLLQPINDLILGFNKNSFEFYEDINLNLFFNFFFKNIWCIFDVYDIYSDKSIISFFQNFLINYNNCVGLQIYPKKDYKFFKKITRFSNFISYKNSFNFLKTSLTQINICDNIKQDKDNFKLFKLFNIDVKYNNIKVLGVNNYFNFNELNNDRQDCININLVDNLNLFKVADEELVLEDEFKYFDDWINFWESFNDFFDLDQNFYAVEYLPNDFLTFIITLYKNEHNFIYFINTKGDFNFWVETILLGNFISYYIESKLNNNTNSITKFGFNNFYKDLYRQDNSQVESDVDSTINNYVGKLFDDDDLILNFNENISIKIFYKFLTSQNKNFINDNLNLKNYLKCNRGYFKNYFIFNYADNLNKFFKLFKGVFINCIKNSFFSEKKNFFLNNNFFLKTNSFYKRIPILLQNRVIMSNNFLKHETTKFSIGLKKKIKLVKLKKKKWLLIKSKYPKFKKNLKKYIKFYKIMLFNLFCLRKSFDLGRFFRAYNTTYNFTSLNFFNLFINAIAYGEISVDYINLHLDEDLDVRLKKVIKNTQSKDIHSNSYLTYNSHFPMLFGDYYLKLKFFRIVKDPISLGINKFQQLYYISIFEKFIKKKFFFKIESNFFKECKPKKQIRGIIEFYKDFQMKFLRNLHTSELLEILWYTFQFKDLRLLSNWLQKIIPMVKLKFHKKLIYNLKRLIEENSGYYMHSLGINGFFVKFKGKISITGNAKKKSSVIRFGSIDLSTKKEKFEYEEDIIITKVGILGYKMFLSFK